MLIVESYSTAIILLFITMLCWGSWANTQKLATQTWPFQLYYWDYTFGVVILSFVFGITFGSMGSEGRGFFQDLQQGSAEALLSAFLGGVVFNIANLLLVAAIDIAGMAVAFPIGIGLALVLGVVVNYVATPLGDPVYLFLGVALVTVAIVLDAFAYKKLPSQRGSTSTKGIVISVVAGLLMGFFFRFVAASVATDFAHPAAGMLTPYSAVFVFSLGILISNFLWNTLFMYKPFKGEAVTYKDYFKKGTPRLHWIGVLGGIIWCIGMSLSMISSEQAGFAISYGLGQDATASAVRHDCGCLGRVYLERICGCSQRHTYPYQAYVSVFYCRTATDHHRKNIIFSAKSMEKCTVEVSCRRIVRSILKRGFAKVNTKALWRLSIH